MNESEPRAELIDPALKAAGWGVVEGSRTGGLEKKEFEKWNWWKVQLLRNS